MVWYSHLFKNFPQWVMIHTVKDFGIVNKTEVDFFFWNSLYFLDDTVGVGNLISGSCLFEIQLEHLKVLGSLLVLLKRILENFKHHFTRV